MGPYKRTQTAVLDAYLGGTVVHEVPQWTRIDILSTAALDPYLRGAAVEEAPQ